MKENNYTFNISDKAISQIKLRSNNNYCRVGIKAAGCSGFQIHYAFENVIINDKDFSFKKDDITVVIDNKSIVYLNNSTLEYSKSLMKEEFKIINENIKYNCGCHESFELIK